jgi:hypothetical protein
VGGLSENVWFIWSVIRVWGGVDEKKGITEIGQNDTCVV